MVMWWRGLGEVALLPKRKRQKKETLLCLVLLHPDKELETLARAAVSLKQKNLPAARATAEPEPRAVTCGAFPTPGLLVT